MGFELQNFLQARDLQPRQYQSYRPDSENTAILTPPTPVATHKCHRMHIQILPSWLLLQLTFIPLKPHLPDTNMTVSSSSGKQGVIMVEAHNFLQRFIAEVCLYCLQILYSEFNPFRVNFRS